MSNYDAWLEKSYQKVAARDDAMVEMAERMVAGGEFESCSDSFCKTVDPCSECIYSWLEAEAEDAAIARYEDRMNDDGGYNEPAHWEP